MSQRMTGDELDPMHKLMADHLLDILKHGEKFVVVNKETGEVSEHRRPPSAATLNQIRQFLKDNGVEAAPTAPRIASLVAGLPFTGGDDEDDAEDGQQVH